MLTSPRQTQNTDNNTYDWSVWFVYNIGIIVCTVTIIGLFDLFVYNAVLIVNTVSMIVLFDLSTILF